MSNANYYRMQQAIKNLTPRECECCSTIINPSGYLLWADNCDVLALCEDDAFLCKACLETVLSEADGAARDCCIVFIHGGLVQKMVLPDKPITFLVADRDIFDGGDAEEKRDFFIRCLMALHPGMRTIW